MALQLPCGLQKAPGVKTTTLAALLALSIVLYALVPRHAWRDSAAIEYPVSPAKDNIWAPEFQEQLLDSLPHPNWNESRDFPPLSPRLERRTEQDLTRASSPPASSHGDSVRSSKEDAHQCLICREDIAPEQLLRAPCGHEFHRQCIYQWTARGRQQHYSSACPVCRQRLTDGRALDARSSGFKKSGAPVADRQAWFLEHQQLTEAARVNLMAMTHLRSEFLQEMDYINTSATHLLDVPRQPKLTERNGVLIQKLRQESGHLQQAASRIFDQTQHLVHYLDRGVLQHLSGQEDVSRARELYHMTRHNLEGLHATTGQIRATMHTFHDVTAVPLGAGNARQIGYMLASRREALNNWRPQYNVHGQMPGVDPRHAWMAHLVEHSNHGSDAAWRLMIGSQLLTQINQQLDLVELAGKRLRAASLPPNPRVRQPEAEDARRLIHISYIYGSIARQAWRKVSKQRDFLVYGHLPRQYGAFGNSMGKFRRAKQEVDENFAAIQLMHTSVASNLRWLNDMCTAAYREYGHPSVRDIVAQFNHMFVQPVPGVPVSDGRPTSWLQWTQTTIDAKDPRQELLPPEFRNWGRSPPA